MYCFLVYLKMSLQKQEVSWAILSAMDVDFDWVAKSLSLQTPAVIISSAPRVNEYKAAAVKRLTPEWVNPTPKMAPGPGVMHTKLCLVSFELVRVDT